MRNRKSKRLFTFLLSLVLTVSTLWSGELSGAWNAGEANAEGAENYGVANPRIAYCSENESGQAVTYDVIEFGSYPQSEVTGAAITTAIKNAAYDKNGDAEVNGIKYRRVTKEDATHVVNDGINNYYNWNSGGDENGYHYFKYEPIRWRVLSVDGEKALLLSETALDDKKYNDTRDDEKTYTWEGCTLRSWLNGYGSAANGDGTDYSGKNYIGSAFTKAEQAAIAETTLTNADNPYYGTEGGNDTRDKVFLLSLSDIRNAEYGFVNDWYTYDEARRVKASTYARAMGTYTESSGSYAGNCWWWLRSPGYYTYYAAYVNISGFVRYDGNLVDNYNHGCCPALYLNLSSVGTWKKAGTYSTGKNAEQPDNPAPGPEDPATDPDEPDPGPDNPASSVANPRLAYCSENTSCRAITYDIIEFGSYPQSEVTGAELTAAIKNAVYDKNGDAEVNGVKYRRVTKEDATYVKNVNDFGWGYCYNWSSGGDENGYHYFKYEPIRWRVLKVDGEKALLLSETALDDKRYNDSGESCTWEGCTMRSWLNGYSSEANGDGTDFTGKNFIGSAFTKTEQAAIATTTLTNADNPDNGTEGGNDTSDKVFLLSLSDIRNTEYGFVNDYDTNDEARRVKASAYAWAMGVTTSYDYAENCQWWLRSPGGSARGAAYVFNDGGFRIDGGNVVTNKYGCCPALYLDLSSSDAWKKAGTYSTGKGEKLPEIPEGSSFGLSNPRVEGADRENCSYTNITYDVIEFGSYPQSEVTGSAITAAIKNAAYDKNGDTEVSGVKYRRVTKEDATYAADYESDSYYNWNSGGDENGYHYFKYEPIRWRVLKVDGEKALLLSETALDDKRYNDSGESCTWEGCTMRSWLNGYSSEANGDGTDFTGKNFIGSAFTKAEEAAIVTTTLTNADNPDNGTEGGNDTSDKVFLLSLSDIRNTEYGFANNGSTDDEARRVRPSTYVRAMGAGTYSGSDYAGNCWWWLRSPGSITYRTACVGGVGFVQSSGDVVDYDSYCCRPTLYLNLSSSDTWKKVGTYSTGNDAEQPDNPATDPDEPASSVANPRMAYCSENMSCRTVTYDVIEFGSYPQSEVTGAELTAAIKNAAYDENGDAEVNGVKYRRVTKKDATYVEDWGNYHYYNWNSSGDESGYHYFKYEPIRWRVLKVDGEKALLLSETALDDKKYNDTRDNKKTYTWEGCTLRSWLNGYGSAVNGDGTDFTEKNFIGSAFTKAEQAAIAETTLINADNPDYGTEGGNDTRDKVFLLSLSDIRNAEYGFVNNWNTSDEARRVKASTYARAMGSYTESSGSYAGNCHWWLRSPGKITNYAAFVNIIGHVNNIGYIFDNYNNGCCPALYLDLSSVDTWKKAGTYSTGNGEKLLEIPKKSFAGISNPKVVGVEMENCSYTNITYDVIEFGSYPQSEVTGAAITAEIKNASYDKNGDAEVNGLKYRRVTKEDATYVDDWGYYYNWNNDGDENGYHYFRYEPIRWRVLSVDGEKALLLSETALDDKKYNDTRDDEKTYTWEGCTLRSWLNGYASTENGDGIDFTGKNFIGSAFTKAEQAAIVPTTLSNADNPEYGTEGGNDTSDKVFLLSLSDIRNAEYGFANNYNTNDEARRVRPSTYARAMGAGTYSESAYAGNCWWWLRSPGSYTYIAASVDCYGNVDNDGDYVDSDSYACCPALYLDLSFVDTWKKAGTYSTGKEEQPDNPTPGPDGPVVEFKRGDVDHDGRVAVADALAILMHLADKNPSNYHADTADCDASGKVAVADALDILMYLADKPSGIAAYWPK